MKCVIAPVKLHLVDLTNTLLTTSSVSISFSTSPADLSLTWTMTATTRTTMTGTVRKPRMVAHTPYCLSVCHTRLKEEARMDSSSLLSPKVSAPPHCLPHSCQSSCLCLQCCLLLLNSQELTRHTHTHKCMFSVKTPRLWISNVWSHLSILNQAYSQMTLCLADICFSCIHVVKDVALNSRSITLSIYSSI